MPDTTVTYEKGQLYQLNLNELQADPNQPRKFMDPQALQDLADSIAQHGVLTPILFRVAPATAQSSALSTQHYVLLSTQHSELAFSPPWGNSRKPSWPC